MAIITPGRLLSPLIRVDAINGGLHKVDVNVNESGSPVRKMVLLFEYPSMILVRSGLSDAVTGLVTFDYIKPNNYVAVGVDRGGVLDADAAGPFASVSMS